MNTPSFNLIRWYIHVQELSGPYPGQDQVLTHPSASSHPYPVEHTVFPRIEAGVSISFVGFLTRPLNEAGPLFEGGF